MDQFTQAMLKFRSTLQRLFELFNTFLVGTFVIVNNETGSGWTDPNDA